MGLRTFERVNRMIMVSPPAGFHGSSVKLTPDVNDDFFEDEECLDCHTEDNDPAAPQSTHSGFHRCLKCHNDTVAAADLIERQNLSDQNP